MTSTATLIGANPNTTPNAKGALFDAARKGRSAARRKVRQLEGLGKWDEHAARYFIGTTDDLIEGVEPKSAEHFRLAAMRAFYVAASA